MVWSDWLDYIPVVGTAKNAVEAISALCQGDYDLAKQKAADAALGATLDVLTAGSGNVAGNLAGRMFENVVLKGTDKEAAVKIVSQQAGRAVVNAASQSARDIISTQRARRGDVGTDADSESRRSRRGEHVINNNVLKVFKNIIDRFLGIYHLHAGTVLVPGSPADRMYKTPLSPDVTNAIREIMVAHIPDNVPYVDANATMYGTHIELITNGIVVHMQAIYEREFNRTAGMETELRRRIYELNRDKLYVDEMAKRYWLENGGSQTMYEEAEAAVVEMFRELVGNDVLFDVVNCARNQQGRQ